MGVFDKIKIVKSGTGFRSVIPEEVFITLNKRARWFRGSVRTRGRFHDLTEPTGLFFGGEP
jgi:hypothetical protein